MRRGRVIAANPAGVAAATIAAVVQVVSAGVTTERKALASVAPGAAQGGMEEIARKEGNAAERAGSLSGTCRAMSAPRL